MKLNYYKSSRENFERLLSTSGYDIFIDQIEISKPVPIIASIDFTKINTDIKPNTKVTLTAIKNGGYVGSKEIRYRRIDLRKRWEALIGENDGTGRFRYRQIDIPTFNEENIKNYVYKAFQVLPDAIDTIVNIIDDTATITIRVKEDNLIYTGDDIVISLSPYYDRVDLAEVFKDRNDIGFEYDLHLGIDDFILDEIEYG